MALHDTLNLRRDEVVPVSLLLFQSVFLGFFLGAFDVGANTLFLNSFGQAMIPRAIVISGITGIALTSLYSYFQSRLNFSLLAVLNLGTVFLLTFLLRAGYYFSDTKWIAFGMFVLMGPLNILAIVGFWGTVGRMFDLRQGKRIFGFIDTGQVLGVIISSLSVPFLVTIGFATKNLLYISAISIFLAVLIQLFISSKYPAQLRVRVAKEIKRRSLIDTLRIPYVRIMAVFVVFSMLVAFFVHFLFLSVADERFESPDEMATFFGGLMGSLTIVSVLIKTFVYGPLMKTYGLRISLLVSPVIMMLVTASAALVGSIFGYTLASGTFTLFFLLVSLGKFFQKALKDSIEGPVLKLIYQSLNPGIRHEVQARVDGTINEIAALSSGVILTLLGLIGAFTLINYTHVLIGIISVWLFISVKLFQGYKRTLKETLENASLEDKKTATVSLWHENLTGIEYLSKYEMIELTRPWLLREVLEEDLKIASGVDLVKLCRTIEEKGFVQSIPLIDQMQGKTDPGPDRETLSNTAGYLKNIIRNAENEELTMSLLYSRNYEERIIAAKYIGTTKNPEMRKNLTYLLRDMVPSVKKQALWAATGTDSKEVISFLTDFLDRDFYAPLAHAALINTGDKGLEMLMMAFNRSNAGDTFRKRIVRVIPETGSPSASAVLFNMLSITSSLKSAVQNGLLKLDFTANEIQALAVHQMLIEQTGVCAWNLNILHHCPSHARAPGLKEELDHNFAVSRSSLFQILKLQYDKSSIDAVVENLEMGTGESISFAIELLDTFVLEDLKPYLFPLLEDSSIANKVWALQNYYPLRSYSTEEMLKAIINRSENLITRQSKIYALNAFSNLENLTVSEDLAAQLFNRDKILQQLSARIISEINEEVFIEYKKRLNDKLRADMNRMMEMQAGVKKNALERFEFYRNNSRTDKSSAPLFWLYNATVMKISGINIFDLGRLKGANHVLLIESGTLELVIGERKLKTFGSGDIMITKGLDPLEDIVRAGIDTIVHIVDYGKLTADLYDNNFLIEYLTGYNINYKLMA